MISSLARFLEAFVIKSKTKFRTKARSRSASVALLALKKLFYTLKWQKVQFFARGCRTFVLLAILKDIFNRVIVDDFIMAIFYFRAVINKFRFLVYIPS